MVARRSKARAPSRGTCELADDIDEGNGVMLPLSRYGSGSWVIPSRIRDALDSVGLDAADIAVEGETSKVSEV